MLTCPGPFLYQDNDPGTNVATVNWDFSYNDNSLIANEPGITNDSFTVTLTIGGLNVSTDLPKLLNIGESRIKYTVADDARNAAECEFSVLVRGKAIQFIYFYVENNTWACGDIEFLFACSTRYLTSERSKRMKYRAEHEKRSLISPCNHALFYYINTLLTRRNRFNSRFKKRTRCYSCIHSCRYK